MSAFGGKADIAGRILNGGLHRYAPSLLLIIPAAIGARHCVRKN
jgi:hypothetical protein